MAKARQLCRAGVGGGSGCKQVRQWRRSYGRQRLCLVHAVALAAQAAARVTQGFALGGRKMK